MTSTRTRLDELALRPWQAEALAAWSQTGRGVVEAVTGTGKTRLALAALRLIVDRGGRALVLVPTLDLQEQWLRELRATFADRRIGRLGGGHDDDLHTVDVLVATPHSAASVPIDLPPATPGILIADEAHRYGAPTWASALGGDFAFRLALTATFERGDTGVDDVLMPYFGQIVFAYDVARAAQDGTIAPYAIATCAVPLTDDERAQYEAADARCRALHRELIGPLGMPREPQQLFAAVSAIVAEADRTGRDGTQVRACREYLVRVRQRRDVAADATHKLGVLATVAPALAGHRSLVFADTVEQAEAAAHVLDKAGLRAETVHGKLDAKRRKIRLHQFRAGNLDAIVAPRVLDEGVDVPDADVAVVLAAFRTRRQMVQRLGRVLRVKSDARLARLLLLVASGTQEDPARGGHADFLDDVRASALSVTAFTTDDHAAVVAWLRQQ